MPRAKRIAARQAEFQVSAWQEPRSKRHRPEEEGEEGCAGVVIMDLIGGQGRSCAQEKHSQGEGASVAETSGRNGAAGAGVETARESFVGTASLSFFDSGQISGHLVDEATRRCMGIMAEEVPMEPECSRGQDWRLVVATIIDFEGGREWKVPLEQTGLDSATLRTVQSLHGLEEEVARVARGGIDMSKLPAVAFSCDTLLADDAAEGHLRRFQPKLAGSGAIVNIGEMSVVLCPSEEDAAPVVPSPPKAEPPRSGPEPSLWSDDEEKGEDKEGL